MIPIYQPYRAKNTKKYVNECLDSNWISSRGKFIEKFEDEFANFIGADDAVSVFNGTVALHLALVAIGIGEGDEVIVPTFTYIASVNTILQSGAKPVFVDCNIETLQIDVSKIKEKINSRTKAIMAVHLYGGCSELPTLRAICDEFGLLLIEDAAEAFGTYYDNQHAGTFGDVATFSFFGNKTITTGEGGMVIARDASIIERLRHLKSHSVSQEREYWHDCLGYNYRMTNIQAAIGLSQLEEADDILAKKREIGQFYIKLFDQLPPRLFNPKSPITNSWWLCSVLTRTPNERDQFRKHLSNNHIETRPFFPLTHEMPHLGRCGSFPISSVVSSTGINLPSFPDLSLQQLDHIAKAVVSFWSEE